MWDDIFKKVTGGKDMGDIAVDMLLPKVVDYVKENFSDNLPDIVQQLENFLGEGTGDIGDKLISLFKSSSGAPDWLDLLNKLSGDDKMKLAMELLKRLKG